MRRGKKYEEFESHAKDHIYAKIKTKKKRNGGRKEIEEIWLDSNLF